MNRRFFALRIVSGLYKLLAILAFIAMVGGSIFVLLDANQFPTLESKLPVIGAAVAAGIIATITLFAIGQIFDLFMAIEINTRNSTRALQKQAKLMNERL